METHEEVCKTGWRKLASGCFHAIKRIVNEILELTTWTRTLPESKKNFSKFW